MRKLITGVGRLPDAMQRPGFTQRLFSALGLAGAALAAEFHQGLGFRV
jgi:hypothetical protein